MYRIICTSLLVLIAFNNYAWNALGHQLVAQIAYDNMTPEARQMCDRYNSAVDMFPPAPDFITAAVWLDEIRKNNVHSFDNLHYIDIPFSKDHSRLPRIPKVNALTGIKQAQSVLLSKKTSLADKGLSLRILIHVVGDIHQPLHTTTKISRRLPKGDLGGNLFLLAKNPIGINLHQYWDNGAGVLIGHGKRFRLRNKAHQLQKRGSCKQALLKNKPEQWIKESHKIAVHQAYSLAPYKMPRKKYRLRAQSITKKQIVYAGCRLAFMLNAIANEETFVLSSPP